MTRAATPMLRWTATREQLPALSIRQPWAWLIVNGFKDVENRTWSTTYRGPLLIHAGSSEVGIRAERAYVFEKYGVAVPGELDFGGVIGLAELTDCRERSRSRWHVPGKIGWILKEPSRLPFRTVKGKLQLFVPQFH